MHEFTLPDMTCGHCASVVSRTLALVDAACRVEIDLAEKKVRVRSTEDIEALAEALAEAGYPLAAVGTGASVGTGYRDSAPIGENR